MTGFFFRRSRAAQQAARICELIDQLLAETDRQITAAEINEISRLLGVDRNDVLHERGVLKGLPR